MLPQLGKGKVIAATVGILGLLFVSSRLSSVPVSNILGGQSGVVVHVAGHVAKPGVYHLATGARLDDAIKAAGGTTDGDTEKLNLAAMAKDGEKITVPAASQVEGDPAVPLTNPTPDVPGKISLSNASEDELKQLPGVGPATIAKIVQYREAHGGFKSIDEIKQVGGIGEKKFAKLEPYLAP